MKFSVDRAQLLQLLSAVDEPGRRAAPERWLKLSASGANVSVQSHRGVADAAAQVLEEGECWLPNRLLAGLVRSHTNKRFLQVEASAEEFRIEQFHLRGFGFAARAATAN